MSLFSHEHYELLAQFEREFKHRRLEKEPKDLWPKGVIFQDGHVNELFIAYRKGHAFGKYEAQQPSGDVVRDAERYRFLAAHCRSIGEHWGGRWSIVIDGPVPKTHDSEDDFDAAIDAAIAASGRQS